MANTIVTRRLLLVQLGVEDAVALVDGRHPNGPPGRPAIPTTALL